MKCDGCTLCCKLLNIPNVSKEGEWCQHCDKGIGCKIHDTDEYPDDCKKYKCSYSFAPRSINPELRPDKCGVVFELATDNIFYGTVDTDFIMNDVVKNQILTFLDKGFSVVLRHLELKAPIIFNAENTTSENVFEELKEIWSHRTTTQI